MSKLIVISPEDSVPNEISLVQKMMGIDPNMRFHFRKLDWTQSQCQAYLNEINNEFHSRISLHQHHELVSEFEELTIHLKESHRDRNHGKSTSFHSKIDMLNLHSDFEYFFCSPVFPSISKTGYTTDENWDINGCSLELKGKAVALGGMTADNMLEAEKMGFENFAFLGSIWQSENPINTFKTILENAK